ncbi:hypothetical protein JIX56_45595 [Streptomyces sp. CA-210063]|uniref:hypothetical protein n=1 Tax=Streptomyces sp. CA-210063 TaxID=2801029 RepID=UPI00214BDABE|nr:hypothetical protein [Streptomyces sp. CA-210063]UUU36515.1 hypothetical protein JIX56_45595 [Streptomyces sp. CA-210063]
MYDELPTGLTVADLTQDSDVFDCEVTETTINYFGTAVPEGNYTFQLLVDVATDAPCTVTNTVESVGSGLADSDSDPTTITGGDCDGDGDGGGGSILPVNLSGILPFFNNITTNNNINSPGASNTSSQGFELNS